MAVQPVKKGDVVYLAGDPCVAAYIVITGAVELTLSGGVTQKIGSGELFGEMSLKTSSALLESKMNCPNFSLTAFPFGLSVGFAIFLCIFYH